MEFSTPMMIQYQKIKNEHKDCILLFRLGDFYEMFMDDAKLGAKILNITLTQRSRGKDGYIPMCGVPYHSVNIYIQKLVNAGHKVAICDQVTEAGLGELVEREVTRIVTPGTVLDENSLDQRENNFIASFVVEGDKVGLALADISTGVFCATEFLSGSNPYQTFLEKSSKYKIAELIVSPEIYEDPQAKILKNEKSASIFKFDRYGYFHLNWRKVLTERFPKFLTNFSHLQTACVAAGALYGYLNETQKSQILQIKELEYLAEDDFVELTRSTIFNLELFSTIREGSRNGSLLGVLDHTKTAMGARMLKQWMVNVPKNTQVIQARLDAVEEFSTNRKEREQLREFFNDLGDIERVFARICSKSANPRDLANLANYLKIAHFTGPVLKNFKSELIEKTAQKIPDDLEKLILSIEQKLVEEPPFDPKQGGLARQGVSKELDELKSTINSSQNFLLQMETREKASTGIPTLKVGFNKIYGYYIEISKSYANQVPSSYIRKQTLVNAERYITEELKLHEQAVLAAEEKINKLEYEIFLQLVEEVKSYIDQIKSCANAVAVLDCLACFSYTAEKENYIKPKLVDTGELLITGGRHPVVEKHLHAIAFVPNDTLLDQNQHQLILLTGPNMAGKSVYIRQVAIITLMAQMGSFVPAESALITPVDKIFVRSGASDFITSGLSTFMVEMVETAHILKSATKDSLIILDEIGRGTTTYDGVSIAGAVAEFLAGKKPFAKTLFATHYHELQALEKKFDCVKNYQMQVARDGESVVFLHKIAKGGASHSYGIEVAKLAGVPDEVVKRAGEILAEFEEKSFEDWLKS